MGRLNGKVALITGAAHGMGEVEASLFVAEGARVVLTDIDNETGNALARSLGNDAIFIRHDVSSESEWTNVRLIAEERFGRIDILVNNAGAFQGGTLVDTSLETYERLIRINQFGAFLGMRTISTAMIGRDAGGSIVNISSIAGLRGTVGMFAYAASKWAVRGMGRCAAIELAPCNIRVNSVHPGPISTAMLNNLSSKDLDHLKARVPLGRMGSPLEVANLVLFLGSNDSSYMTGTELQIDGGNVA